MIAVLSAAEVMDGSKKVLCSHPGASFGSLAYKQFLSFKDAMNIGVLLKNYANESEFITCECVVIIYIIYFSPLLLASIIFLFT